MQTLQIKNFKGINLEEGLWREGFAKYTVAVDVFGLGDNPSKQSFNGIIQNLRKMAFGTEAAAPNDVTELVRWMVAYPTTGNVWAFSLTTTPRLYERTGGTWTLRRSTASGDLAVTNYGGLIAFAASLWTAQDARISRWDNASWTPSFATLTNSVQHPMKVYANTLFIGDGNLVDKISTTPTFTGSALTLSNEWTIKSMEIYVDKLYIMADNGSFSRMFIWDGSATTVQNFFDLRDEPTAPYLIHNEGILWAIPPRGSSTSGVPIYIFNGTTFEKIMVMPGLQITPNQQSVATYRGGLLISSNSGAATYEDGVGGVWMINRYDSAHPWQFIIAFNPSVGVTNVNIGAIYSSGQNVYVGTQDVNGAVFEIWEMDGSVHNSNGIWQSLPIDIGDASRPKLWHSIQIDNELDIDTSRTLTIKYRVDYAASFTTLGTITNATGSKRNFPIGRTGKVIEIRLENNASSANFSTRIHGFTLNYTPCNQ